MEAAAVAMKETGAGRRSVCLRSYDFATLPPLFDA
jgi:hypothetical protein